MPGFSTDCSRRAHPPTHSSSVLAHAACQPTSRFRRFDSTVCNGTTGSFKRISPIDACPGELVGSWVAEGVRNPEDSCWRWFIYTRNDGPYNHCAGPAPNEWTMLYTYRSDSIQGIHWVYMDEGGGACMTNWKYYAEDGKTLIAQIYGTGTTVGSTRPWCALPVYGSEGVERYQWSCSEVHSHRVQPGSLSCYPWTYN